LGLEQFLKCGLDPSPAFKNKPDALGIVEHSTGGDGELIDGADLIPLRQIGDERGKVMHMLRSDTPHFTGFGEIYFSSVHPGIVKAWHLQCVARRHYAVPVGRIRAVLYDDRVGSPTAGAVEEFLIGEDNYQLLIIPPGIWSGFVALGEGPALVADCMTAPHVPAEARRRDPVDPSIPYRWDIACT
jgi:dTDP-4-dehydrorhamnose 3,5-epimerase